MTDKQDQNERINKWTLIPTDEKETIINFDYQGEKLSIYTTNQFTAKKLRKKIGQPIKTNFEEGMTASEEWTISFKDREKIKKILSISNFVTFYLSKKEN